MVFSSVPAYLDPPNWNQQGHQAASGSVGGGDVHQHPQMAAVAPLPEGGMPGSIRPVSMAERARLAKIPQPEPALKCPRCDSTNTKFCYFNNYSLSQPRHFCKTCRRYWTRGGALRNVPVGGGCRRNKRGKATGSSSKSSATSAASSSSASSAATSAAGGAILSSMPPPPPPLHLPFMASLHPMADFGAANLGLSFSGIQPLDTVEYQVGSSSNVGLGQWRLPHIQQFPFLGGLEPMAPPPAPGLFSFDGEGGVGGGGYPAQVHQKQSSSSLITQLASVKMEDNPQWLSLPRQYLGIPGNDQYWSGSAGGGSTGGGGSGWATDLSSFNSSTSGSLL